MFGRWSGKWLGLGATYLCTPFPAAAICIPQTFGERESSLRGLLSEQAVLCGLLSRRARGSWLGGGGLLEQRSRHSLKQELTELLAGILGRAKVFLGKLLSEVS